MKRYEKYKPSGVEWLGEVPEHWEVKPLKFLTTKIVDGSHFTPTYIDTGVPFLRVTDIQNNNINMENIKYIPQEEHLELVKRCNPEKGDLLLSKNGTIGVTKVIDWNWEFSIFVSLCLIKFNTKINSTFAHYVFESHSLQEQIFGLTKKNTVTNLHLDKIREFWFIVPTLNEQLGIINFLDKKTEKIDRLISRQQALLEKLSEKRTALITEAVCGRVRLATALNDNETLSSNVPLRNSGIEWLGEVPEHWEIKRLKFVGKLQGGIGFPHDYQNVQDLELPFYKVGDLGLSKNNRNMPKAQHTINNEIAHLLGAKIIPPNCILYAKVGAALLLNRRRINDEKCCIDNNMTAFIPNFSKITTAWAFYSLSIIDFKVFVNPGAIPSLSEGYQENLQICIPPLEEQTAIVNYLDTETAKIDRLQHKIERVIERLKEYRSALITQVVTGKVKV